MIAVKHLLVAAGIASMTLMPRVSIAEEARMLDVKLNDAFAKGELPGLHAVHVALRGETIAEVYFRGADERWGLPLGEREQGPETLHDLRSVTKSIVGLLYGIALREGKVPALDAPLLAQFPEYADLADDPARNGMRVGHALAMRMGTEWNEQLPYSDPRNSEITMETAEDRYRFALDRPMVDEPGASWTYNGGAVAIVGQLIADGTGMPLDDYAEEKLFRPLGIDDFEWIKGADGVPSAASGLRLKLRDLARIGEMVARGGEHKGRQIVPAEWLERSFEPRSDVEGGLRYGYLWWLAGQGAPPVWVAGFGNGGQRLTIQPESRAVVTIFAGNYNKPDAWQVPVKVIEDFVVPEVRARLAQ